MSASNPTPPHPVVPLNSFPGRQHLCIIEFSKDVNQPSHNSSDLHKMPPNKTRCRRVLTHVPHVAAATASVFSDHRRSSLSKYLWNRLMMSAQQIDRCLYLSLEKQQATRLMMFGAASAFPSCSGLLFSGSTCRTAANVGGNVEVTLKSKCFTATRLIFFSM